MNELYANELYANELYVNELYVNEQCLAETEDIFRYRIQILYFLFVADEDFFFDKLKDQLMTSSW